MKEMKANTYSNNDIEKAGRIFLNEKVSPDDFSWAMDVWSFWRYSHEKPLGIAFSLIQKEGLAIDKKCIFAKRLKRYISIVNKLKRFESMNLRNVQDIGGCRIVVNSSKKLNKIVKSLKKRSEFQGFD
jgi:ppGpp synthetase/RelA/SpoT-type nucleotidyltranferase